MPSIRGLKTIRDLGSVIGARFTVLPRADPSIGPVHRPVGQVEIKIDRLRNGVVKKLESLRAEGVWSLGISRPARRFVLPALSDPFVSIEVSALPQSSSLPRTNFWQARRSSQPCPVSRSVSMLYPSRLTRHHAHSLAIAPEKVCGSSCELICLPCECPPGERWLLDSPSDSPEGSSRHLRDVPYPSIMCPLSSSKRHSPANSCPG